MPKMPDTGNFKAVALPRPETVPARCIQAIDVGTVDNPYMGEAKRSRKVLIVWELPTLKAVFSEEKGEEPFTIFVEEVFSKDDRSNFVKIITNWRNKPLTEEEKQSFDYAKLIGKVCLISFQIKTKGKYKDSVIEQATNQNSNLKLGAISPLPKVMKDTMPAMINPPVVWDWDKLINGEEVFNQEKFKKIWKFIRTKMYTSDEWNQCPGVVNIDAEQQEGAASNQNTTQQVSQPIQAPAQPVQQTPSQPEQEIEGDDW